MPEFAIVDAHVHLYDVERLSYGWRHRKDRMPKVPPLPPEEDDWRK